MDYLEICEEQAAEYAERAALGGANYDDAYEYYLRKRIEVYKNKGEELDEIDFN